VSTWDDFTSWLSDKTQPYKAKPYNIDPNAFTDPNAAALSHQWQQLQNQYGNQAATQIDQSGVQPYQQGQLTLAQHLMGQANGTAPSVADAQAKAAADRGMTNSFALASGARGGMNPALAQRQALDANANITQGVASQSTAARLQEQQQAQQTLSGVLSSGANTAAGLATNQAQLGAQQKQMNDQMVQYFQSLGYSADQAQFAAQQAMQQLQVQQNVGLAGVNQQASAQSNSMLGSVLGAAGPILTAVGLSDERQKKDVSSGNATIYDFLDKLHAKDFQYRNPAVPGAAPGPQTGVMAQDVASSPVGSQMVVQTPNGLALDPARGIGPLLAATADLHQRVKSLEDARGAGGDLSDSRLTRIGGRVAPKPGDAAAMATAKAVPTAGKTIVDFLMGRDVRDGQDGRYRQGRSQLGIDTYQAADDAGDGG
jgi:hypothetical protein